jgi:hypothetical protein
MNERRSMVSVSIEAILTSVSPEIARRVEEHKAREMAAQKQRATEFQAAERATMVTRKVQRTVVVRTKTWVAEKLAEVLGLQRSM